MPIPGDNDHQSSEERISVLRMAPSDWRDALALARQIGHPWFRCQALAHLAYVCPDKEQKPALLKESFKAANEEKDPYSIVGVSSFPLATLTTWDGEHPAVEEHVSRLLGVISAEPNPVRRMDALFYLSTGLWRDRECYLQVLPVFRRTAGEAKSWKVAHNVIGLLRYAYRVYPEVVPELLSLITAPKMQRRAERELKKIADEMVADQQAELRVQTPY